MGCWAGPTGQGRRQGKSGPSLEPSHPQCHKHCTNAVTSESLEWVTLGSCPRDTPGSPQPSFLCSLRGKPTPLWSLRGARGWQCSRASWLSTQPQHSLSGVQSVNRGTSRGTLSMFCRWGRTWWMPRGSLACREQRRAWPQDPSSLLPSFPCPGPAPLPTPRLRGHSRTRLQSSRKLGRSLSVGWKLMRSE